MKLSKSGLKFSLGYLGIFLAYSLVSISTSGLYPSASLLVGLVGIILTLPFSLLVAPILDSLGYIAWYDQFVSNPPLYTALAVLGLLPMALINATILYYLARTHKPQKSKRQNY